MAKRPERSRPPICSHSISCRDPVQTLMRSQSGDGRLKVLGEKPGAAGDTGEHSRPQFFIVPKGEHVVGPSWTRQYAVRPGLPERPADPRKRPQDAAGSCGGPRPHRETNRSLAAIGAGSPRSIRSAITRRASAAALFRASASVAPYTSTPGSSGTSPIQRPSSSWSISIVSIIAPRPHRRAYGGVIIASVQEYS
jgi:hypothetical protein